MADDAPGDDRAPRPGAPAPEPPRTGDRPRPLDLVLVALLAVAALGGHALRHPLCVSFGDEFEYAAVGRNIAEGAGTTTPLAYAIDLALFRTLPHPLFVHPPGQSYAIAGAMTVLGPTDLALALPNLLAFVAVALIAHVLAASLWGRRAGWWAAGLCALHVFLLRHTTGTMAEMTAAAMLLAAVAVAFSARTLAGHATAGLLAAGSYWFRENTLFAIPALALTHALLGGPGAPQRVRRVLAFAGGCALGVAPLVARSLVLTGTPWFSYTRHSLVAFTKTYPDVDVLHMVHPPTIGQFLSQHPGEFSEKVMGLAARLPCMFVTAAGPLVAGLVLLHFAQRNDGPRRWFGIMAVLMVALTIAGCSTFAGYPRYFLPLVPVAIVLAAGSMERLARAAGPRRRWCHALVAVAALWTAAKYFVEAATDEPRTDFAGLQQFAAERTAPGAWIACDAPQFIIWPQRLQGMVLPVDRAGLEEIHRTVPMRYVLLTSLYTRTRQFRDAWFDAFETRAELPNYREVARYGDAQIRAVLFERRP